MSKRVLFTILGCLLFIQTAHACRFWVAAGKKIPPQIMEQQLLLMPHALKKLGSEYSDGWSVGYYEEGEGIVFRGSRASHLDQRFDRAVEDSIDMEPKIVFGHLRRASSGCVDGVTNPHPFEIIKNGQTWLFGHNGGMKKQILIDLIGEKYLKDNPPGTCTYEPPHSWVDSELYFIYLMKFIEENKFHVEKGLQKGLSKLYRVLDQDSRFLNFFLTNGDSVWAYREGTSLYYKLDKKNHVSIVASTIPSENKGAWKEFPKGNIGILTPKGKIKFLELSD